MRADVYPYSEGNESALCKRALLQRPARLGVSALRYALARKRLAVNILPVN